MVARRTGVRPAAGRRSTVLGTHSALLSLGPTAYLEIVAPDPSQVGGSGGGRARGGASENKLRSMMFLASRRIAAPDERCDWGGARNEVEPLIEERPTHDDDGQV